ncbi:uncharacterized protein EV420DRAFT_1277632 [Desarmillaria tabescens]|uniref:Uncharacterized protein n=1 Tax=Armillaria tabescens TaxID=1929756 RepID=A0AA39JJF3_ARMTA|nr:uncharacterized protein EV420DRAFT_1277632 [Desarmillaria tabescens]KAK0443887.1 hypothetical protein EV420DRAFT_1277632 [Desarmillaria tabescens]
MKTSSILSLFVTVPLVSAVNITVSVGKDDSTGQKGLGFNPPYIYPNIGDLIVFVFQSGTHSVVESNFTKPCVPNGRFDTGVQTVPDSAAVDSPDLPRFEYYINSTDSLWFSDQAGNNCNQGAIFCINPTAAQTADQFQSNAMAAPINDTTSAANGSSTSAPPVPIRSSSGLGLTAVICRNFCTDVCDKTCFYVDLTQKHFSGHT